MVSTRFSVLAYIRPYSDKNFLVNVIKGPFIQPWSLCTDQHSLSPTYTLVLRHLKSLLTLHNILRRGYQMVTDNKIYWGKEQRVLMIRIHWCEASSLSIGPYEDQWHNEISVSLDAGGGGGWLMETFGQESLDTMEVVVMGRRWVTW